ncbi:hypothetical protein [Trinickia dinghuensis]|uniref:SH3 domain-containing protein n=1 Tax=Trinickia dinghuensis TaxID=2291023 RepID=A0A3D8JWJ4_9BURK|nr:hypothetical protein [Trinickia dinghuensis]RDU97439.1 hypothetical protein DWV00_19735 [Trinickia dinghuensis]
MMLMDQMAARVPLPKNNALTARAARIGALIAAALLLSCGVTESALAATPPSALRFALPGGAAILYSNAVNPQDPLGERAWKKAVFYFPNGVSFGLLPRVGESNVGVGTAMEPPSDSDIAPSGQYVVIARDEQGTISTGPGQPESVLSREYCSMIEIRTGCITADQTGEICGAGWKAGNPAQWGTDDRTDMMLRRDRPSAGRQLGFIRAGQPAQLTIRDDSGADNLLRCDPVSSVNRESYRKIAAALQKAGANNDARLIANALSQADGKSIGTPVPAAVDGERRAASVSAEKARLYLAPDEAHASRAYLIQNDAVTVLKQSPTGWAYVDYIDAFGKHLLRWIRTDQLAIRP